LGGHGVCPAFEVCVWHAGVLVIDSVAAAQTKSPPEIARETVGQERIEARAPYSSGLGDGRVFARIYT